MSSKAFLQFVAEMNKKKCCIEDCDCSAYIISVSAAQQLLNAGTFPSNKHVPALSPDTGPREGAERRAENPRIPPVWAWASRHPSLLLTLISPLWQWKNCQEQNKGESGGRERWSRTGESFVENNEAIWSRIRTREEKNVTRKGWNGSMGQRQVVRTGDTGVTAEGQQWRGGWGVVHSFYVLWWRFNCEQM